jgi:hypothetical protein
MLTTRHPVDFAYTRLELEALFRYANEHDVDNSANFGIMEQPWQTT